MKYLQNQSNLPLLVDLKKISGEHGVFEHSFTKVLKIRPSLNSDLSLGLDWSDNNSLQSFNDWDLDQSSGPEMAGTGNGTGPAPGTGPGPKMFSGYGMWYGIRSKKSEYSYYAN